MNVQLLTPERRDTDLNELPFFDTTTVYGLAPFDERTLAFFDTFSKKLLADRSVNRLPEIAALAFWIRRANLLQIQKENSHLFGQAHFSLSPLGRVFHVCPANVDTMFIYSLAVSVLMGNKNLLRISARMEAPQITFLFDTLNELLGLAEFALFRDYIHIITYPHNDAISTAISGRCNARVIWGGDSTIAAFRDFKPAPRTRDIVFADRVSLLCIDCNAFNELDAKGRENFARLFFNDAYTFDQKGCSSPQSVFLLGDEAAYETCVTEMVSLLSGAIAGRYDTDIASIASLKLNRMVDDTLDRTIDHKWGDNYVTFAALRTQDATEAALPHSCGGGYFYTRRLDSVDGLLPFVDNKLQTVSYFGLDDTALDALVSLSRGEGIDRIVPLGHALDFNYIWDGYNLLEALSRKIYLER
ncbi:acyl-CoA reductase [Taibaiella chishuiensis]|uniref:Acyl-CoA reductase LuxC n=1 Tax=Taibaiella chishuiensis TaxID=1434707 RepID=A0A2P8D9S3_9BACT|nr:acyl-CoA reductase [Taibaiella chishuiensis]PSK93974.1 acyl-CoA reductase LuxC [Taibaiella chishuiensis]